MPPTPRHGQSAFPLILIMLGVIVVGFAIGAGISLVARNRAANAPVAVASAAPTSVPTASQTQAAPSPAPSPSAAPTATPATPAPSASSLTPPPSPTATASNASPRASQPASSVPRVAVVPSLAPLHTPVPPLRPPTQPPTASPTAAPTALPEPTDEADSDFSRLAASVVRAYLSALARGDDAAARASLDAPAGSSAAQLSEKTLAGPGMRITGIQAQGTGDNATVNVDIGTPQGAYFAQFFVKRSPTGAAVIYNHSVVPVGRR